jgi:hypothetical protein
MQPATADESGDQARIFLFVGGKVLSYYFGLGDGRNYI